MLIRRPLYLKICVNLKTKVFHIFSVLYADNSWETLLREYANKKVYHFSMKKSNMFWVIYRKKKKTKKKKKKKKKKKENMVNNV